MCICVYVIKKKQKNAYTHTQNTHAKTLATRTTDS